MIQCFEPITKQLKQTNLFRNKPKQTESNRNNPKFSEKYQNVLSFKLFRLVFCLFRFNRNIETLCFGIEPKQPKQTVSKQSETNRNNPKFLKKYQNILSITLFRLLFCLFRFNRNTETLCFYRTETTETNVLDSAETSFGSSFGSSFGRFELKLVSNFTLYCAYRSRLHI